MASLRASFETWRIAPEIVERCLHDTHSVVDFIRQNGLIPGRLMTTYNGIELWTDISYLGTHEPPIELRSDVPVPERPDVFANEETAALIGLRDFLKSAAADKKHVRRHGARLVVRLSYEAP